MSPSSLSNESLGVAVGKGVAAILGQLSQPEGGGGWWPLSMAMSVNLGDQDDEEDPCQVTVYAESRYGWGAAEVTVSKTKSEVSVFGGVPRLRPLRTVAD